MWNKGKRFALIVMLIESSSISNATFCPPSEDVRNKIEELANHGNAIFRNTTYHLISKPETSIFYTGKLLENDAQLNGFLKVTKVFDKNLPEKVEARLLPLLPTPNFCAYKISLGENIQIIALSAKTY